MADFIPYGEVQTFVHVSLTLGEAKALDALAGYSTDSFLKVFYKEMGEAYLKPHEKALRSLFEKAKHEISGIIWLSEETETVHRRTKVAIDARDLKRLRERLAELEAE